MITSACQDTLKSAWMRVQHVIGVLLVRYEAEGEPVTHREMSWFFHFLRFYVISLQENKITKRLCRRHK